MPRFCLKSLALTLLTGLIVAPLSFAEDKTVTITISSDSSSVKPAKEPFVGNRPSVDVAILLDTSNSMDGLISQAKKQIWTIVQQFAQAQKDGKTPSLKVALFEYGNTNLPASEGYIRQVVSLTDDLDAFSEALFSLRTRGGDEYCGQVIQEALDRLDWSNESNAFKAIFIAGNEPFTQGSVDYQEVCRRAIQSGVVVNTIHCGANAEGIRGKWKHGADLAEGKFFNIDQDKQVVHIDCPQDKLIIELNAKLNKTYLWYGQADARRRFAENQVAQDENARSLDLSVLSSRVVAKGGRGYDNSKRDLVDAFFISEENVLNVQADQLPAELQNLSKEERLSKVKSMAETRRKIQQEIAKLNREREQYLADQRERQPVSAPDTLGEAVSSAVQEQLEASGFEVKK